jgi:hypothetical protein
MGKRQKPKVKKSRHTVGEYFVAALGVLMIAGVVVIVATSESCRIGPSPDIGIQPSRPTPTPTRPSG